MLHTSTCFLRSLRLTILYFAKDIRIESACPYKSVCEDAVSIKKLTLRPQYVIFCFMIAAIVLAVTVFFLTRRLEDTYRENSAVTLSSMAVGLANVAHLYIDNSSTFAQTIADFLAKTPDFSPEKALGFLEQATIFRRYRFFGIITPNGHVFSHADHGKTLGFDERTIKKLQNAKSVSLAVANDDGLSRNFSLITAPIKSGEEDLGLFFLGTHYNLLRSLVANNTMSGLVDYYIIDEKGIVVNSTNSMMQSGFNLFDALLQSKRNDSATVAQLQEECYENAVELHNLYLNGEEHYLSFAPMPHEGWVVVTLLPVDVLRGRIQEIIFFVISTIAVWLVLFLGFAVYTTIQQRRSSSVLRSYAEQLQMLINSLPGGAMRCLDDERQTIVHYSQSLLEILGISEADMAEQYQNSWRSFVHDEDMHILDKALNDGGQGIVHMEYRLRTKEEKIVWITDTTRVMEDETGRWYWCMVIDTSELKNMQAREARTTERYRILFEISESILYEYDLTHHVLRASGHFFKSFGYAVPEQMVEENYYPLDISIIHPDDMDLFMSMQYKIKASLGAATALLRIRSARDQWFWCKVNQVAWVDRQDNSLKAIGKIENVDEETRAMNKLLEDVQRDPFTGLFNKPATGELVQREISADSTKRGALCIIDVDNFKQVNDSLGHAMGDTVIKRLASGLAGIFRSDDIVGRIGGDEFIVYVKNMPKLRPLLQKMDVVMDFFKQTFEDGDIRVSISCSVGIALFPKDGESYEELYKLADKALYRSKLTKGTYNFYDKDIDGDTP